MKLSTRAHQIEFRMPGVVACDGEIRGDGWWLVDHSTESPLILTMHFEEALRLRDTLTRALAELPCPVCRRKDAP